MPQKERLKKPLNIGIITPPIGSAGVFPLSNLIDIISYISNLNYVITGEVKIKPKKIIGRNIPIYKIRYFSKSNIIKKIIFTGINPTCNLHTSTTNRIVDNYT